MTDGVALMYSKSEFRFLQVLRTWLHCNPQSAKAWVYLGLWQLYSQQENVNGSTLSALKLLKTAEKLLDKNGDEEHDKLYPMILLAEAECHTKLAHQASIVYFFFLQLTFDVSHMIRDNNFQQIVMYEASCTKMLALTPKNMMHDLNSDSQVM